MRNLFYINSTILGCKNMVWKKNVENITQKIEVVELQERIANDHKKSNEKIQAAILPIDIKKKKTHCMEEKTNTVSEKSFAQIMIANVIKSIL